SIPTLPFWLLVVPVFGAGSLLTGYLRTGTWCYRKSSFPYTPDRELKLLSCSFQVCASACSELLSLSYKEELLVNDSLHCNFAVYSLTLFKQTGITESDGVLTCGLSAVGF